MKPVLVASAGLGTLASETRLGADLSARPDFAGRLILADDGSMTGGAGL